MKPVGQSVLQNHLFLKKIVTTKSDRKRRRLLRLATNEELFSIIEIAFNILKGKFKLSNRQKVKLIAHADLVRKISRARSKRGLKSALQTGGSILPALIAPILIEAFRLLKNGN